MTRLTPLVISSGIEEGHTIQRYVDILAPFKTSLMNLKLQPVGDKLLADAEHLARQVKDASILLITLCVAQLFLNPSEWSNIRAQVQEAYKLADVYKLKRDSIPPAVKDIMEQMKSGGKKSEGGSAVDGSSQAGSAAGEDSKATQIEMENEEEEDDDMPPAENNKGRGRGGRGRGRAAGAGKANAKANRRATSKRGA